MMLRMLFMLLTFTVPVLGSGEQIRTAAPKLCFLHSWGKGPNWFAEVGTEFRRGHLDGMSPDVDESFSEPTAELLKEQAAFMSAFLEETEKLRGLETKSGGR